MRIFVDLEGSFAAQERRRRLEGGVVPGLLRVDRTFEGVSCADMSEFP
jgi:hypothetical protein